MDATNDALGKIDEALSFLPDWAVSLCLIGLAVLIAWWVHSVLFNALIGLVSEQNLFRRSLVARIRRPSRLALIMIFAGFAASVAPLSRPEAAGLRHFIVVGIICLMGWIAITALNIWLVIHLRRFKLDSEDNLLARKHVTQSRILQRVAETIIAVVTVSTALMTFDGVRQYGVSLLASAGAAGIVIGLALQPMLKNLIAGIQLAITQPIRIDDALLIENEWGNVEEITSSYVVVRLWDWRRMIVPLSHFIEKPFQNWTREGAALIGSVYLYVDFTVPVATLRQRLEEIVRSSKLWDGKVVALQVTDFKETVMELRMLVSASNSGRAFDLRCEIRERMIAFVQENYPASLPRLRTEWSNAGGSSLRSDRAALQPDLLAMREKAV